MYTLQKLKHFYKKANEQHAKALQTQDISLIRKTGTKQSQIYQEMVKAGYKEPLPINIQPINNNQYVHNYGFMESEF